MGVSWGDIGDLGPSRVTANPRALDTVLRRVPRHLAAWHTVALPADLDTLFRVDDWGGSRDLGAGNVVQHRTPDEWRDRGPRLTVSQKRRSRWRRLRVFVNRVVSGQVGSRTRDPGGTAGVGLR